MSYRRINMSDVMIGHPLPWNVFDSKGSLLLIKGYLVEKRSQIQALIDRGLFADTSTWSMPDTREAVEQEVPSVVRLLGSVHKRLERLLFELDQDAEFPEKLQGVAQVVIHAVELNPDIAIACILRNQQANSYPIKHCVDAALLSVLVARSVNVPDEELVSLVAAALTMNVSLLHDHDELQHKQGALTEEETRTIRLHPQESVRLLQEAGVSDPKWLAYVLAHHENEDGSGYPEGKKAGEIPGNSKIISLADRYCARISTRDYRKPVLPKTALRDIFLERGKEVDPGLAAHFIQILGIYPPGTLVRLNNGEIGVVTHRVMGTATPTVHVLIGPRGQLLAFPIKRETDKKLFAIQESLTEEQASIRFSMHQVWGDEASL